VRVDVLGGEGKKAEDENKVTGLGDSRSRQCEPVEVDNRWHSPEEQSSSRSNSLCSMDSSGEFVAVVVVLAVMSSWERTESVERGE
jgi:hypothetical protein